ncbi:uncharacterized protein LOC121530426, partial [Drosophila eugracilis]|uniref:uncharacterized protein LOC121530426 n=1 Tax=Drosophila eugracilis TaxID=29029 RepID=UPI001BD94377
QTISFNQPERFVVTSQWNIPSQIDPADPGFYMTHRIVLLISTQAFFDLLSNGKISLGPGLPCLVNTALGWIVGGKVSDNPQLARSTELQGVLERFWLIEEFDSHDQGFTVKEQECERHFVANTRFLTSGRVSVCLPFKPNERRLSRNPLLKEMYVQFMREYIVLNHMQLASDFESQKKSGIMES